VRDLYVSHTLSCEGISHVFDVWGNLSDEVGLFIIRVKRELKRVHRNGCRYNERLNAETGGSKTSRTHWVARVNI
jgi:hypothetical protein